MIRTMKPSTYVARIRKRLGLTPLELATLIGRHRTTVLNYEAGRIIPAGDIILKLQDLAAKFDKENFPTGPSATACGCEGRQQEVDDAYVD